MCANDSHSDHYVSPIKSVCLCVHLQAMFGCMCMFVVSVQLSCVVQAISNLEAAVCVCVCVCVCMYVCVCVLFYLCLPSDKYTGPCNWGKEGGRERERERKIWGC